MEKRLGGGHHSCCSVLWVSADFHQMGDTTSTPTEKAEFFQEHQVFQDDQQERAGETAVEHRSVDSLYSQAILVVIREGRGSVSLLQRFLGIGYGRAAKIIDFMEEDGIVGPHNGSMAREVLFSRAKAKGEA